MNVIEIEKLIQEVSPDLPSGDNLEYDPKFLKIVQDAQGKPEQQVGESVKEALGPNWRAVKKESLGLLNRSKDLRLGVYLANALLNTDGFAGLSDGLELIRGLVEKHWDTVHPQLDPEDGNDPTMRVNTLVGLCDPETMVRRVRELPLVKSRVHGRFSLRDVLIAAGKLPPPKGDAKPPEMSAIEGAFQEIDLEELKATEATIGKSIEQINAIESILTEKVGSNRAADFSELTTVLKGAQRTVGEQLVRRGVAVAVEPGEAGADAEGAPGAEPQSISGPIASREDAIRALDRVCEFFSQSEPSSPVPILLRRAQKLVAKDFVELIKDLAPDGLSQIDVIRGPRAEE